MHPLRPHRYKLEWTVVNGADASNSVMKESQFFYIGACVCLSLRAAHKTCALQAACPSIWLWQACVAACSSQFPKPASFNASLLIPAI